ncbi:MAG: alpha/beta hydrolase [Rhodospirillaceae bacterium]|nr:alpha/beta hydrolase [Rhodospirillaceae bacterium]
MSAPVILPDHRTGTVESGDVTIFYRHFGPLRSDSPRSDSGAGTPMIVLHGQSYFSYDWIGIADELARDPEGGPEGGREIVAMDMRGFGSSGWSPGQAYKVQNFAADVLAVADSRGWDRFVLAGHSMGGRNATYTAAALPERVEKLILIDYSPTNAKAGSMRVMDQSVDMPESFSGLDEALRYFGLDPARVDAAKRARFEAYLGVFDGNYTVSRDPYFREVFRKTRDEGVKPDHGADLWACLGRVACPILVLRGRQSDMFAPETAEKVRAANANVTLVEVEGGHNIPGDNPAGLIAALRPFLADRSAGA